MSIDHPLATTDDWTDEEIPVARPVLRAWVRAALLGIAAGLFAVFAVAAWLNPYEGGVARLDGTHQLLGLPPCSFKVMTGGLPCPSCGMTTSFALLVRGDVWNSARANFVGTLLAAACLAYIPWAVACALRGRPLGVVSIERVFSRLVVLFMALMLLRWAVVLVYRLG